MRKLLIGVLLLLLPLASLAAEDVGHWSSVAGWDIKVDRTLGYGCFMVTEFEDNILFRIGFNRKNDTGYLIVYDNDWRSIELGKEYKIAIRFDNEDPWEAPMYGRNVNGVVMLVTTFSDPDFLTQFMQKHTIKMFYDNSEIARLSLEGSYAAGEEMFECQ